VHEPEVHEASDAKYADALCECAGSTVCDEPVGEVDDGSADDEGYAAEGRVPPGCPKVGEADSGEWVIKLRWPACGIGPEGNEDD
jgi:hypothetical protein